MSTVVLIVPTLNAGKLWQQWIQAVQAQAAQIDTVAVVDSGSVDDTVPLAVAAGFDVHSIDKSTFNHGGTRQMAVDMFPAADIVILMTQDAVLQDAQALGRLLAPFEDDKVAAVCGRQLPRPQAGLIESHIRVYNYPAQSTVNSVDDRAKKGLKTVFLSNSFAAYRVSALKEVGGFPNNVIFGEDMYVAARLINQGWRIAYAADACVYHSHDYSVRQDFSRYFDMGVFHACEPWIRQDFGSADRAGVGFVMSSLRFLAKRGWWKIPEAILRVVASYLGFRAGLAQRWLPRSLKRVLSMNSGYFG